MASESGAMMGEDIAGNFGGAFKVTKGLEEEFGGPAGPEHAHV